MATVKSWKYENLRDLVTLLDLVFWATEVLYYAAAFFNANAICSR